MLNFPSQCNEIYNSLVHHEIPYECYFVFGSNLAGRHGAGAAKIAHEKYGAKYGQGIGFSGKSYAIPTKDENLNVLPLITIKKYVDDFVDETQQANHFFYLTPVGCGLAGYHPSEIAPMFKDSQFCWVPSIWLPYFFQG